MRRQKFTIHTEDTSFDVDVVKFGGMVDRLYAKIEELEDPDLDDLLTVSELGYITEVFDYLSQSGFKDKLKFCSILRGSHRVDIGVLEIESMKEMIRLKHWLFKYSLIVVGAVAGSILFMSYRDGSFETTIAWLYELFKTILS